MSRCGGIHDRKAYHFSEFVNSQSFENRFYTILVIQWEFDILRDRWDVVLDLARLILLCHISLLTFQ